MVDIWRQVIAVDDENDPDPENIPDKVPQLLKYYNCKLEGMIFPRRLKHLYHTSAAFRNYSPEDVMKMKKLELFLILFTVEYLKEVLVPKKINL